MQYASEYRSAEANVGFGIEHSFTNVKLLYAFECASFIRSGMNIH